MSGTAIDTARLPDTPVQGDGAVRDELCQLAAKVAQATRRLSVAVAEKDRLSRMLNSVLEGVDAGVVLARDDGAVVAANSAARALGAVCAHRDSPNRLQLERQLIDATANPGSEQLLQSDGGELWLVRIKRVQLDEATNVWLLLVQDVTAVMKLQEQAERRSRLELVGRMAAELAHEIRNPLGSLELFASMLCEELTDRDQPLELAESLLIGVRQLSRTVTRLLSAARERSGDKQPHDVVAIARESAEFIRPVCESRGIQLEFVSDISAKTLDLDIEGLRQALLNLLRNAVDHTPEGGSIEMRVEKTVRGVGLACADSGPGVPENLKKQIFEPFFTTRAEGNGLGLALVERVAVLHGGYVELSQSRWGGAEFRLVVCDGSQIREESIER